MSQGDWTDERIELLRSYYAEGISYALIAGHINEATGSTFTRNACIGKALRIGIAVNRTRPPQQRVEKRRKPKRAAPLKHRDDGSRLPNGATPPDWTLLEKIETMTTPAEFLGITLFDLEPQHCRYPRGGNDGEPILFCGQPKQDDSSYCEACHARCHGGRTYNILDEERARRSGWAAQISARRRTGRAA